MSRTPWLALTAWREKDGYTITGLAEAATKLAASMDPPRPGISRPYVSQLESGRREPTPQVTWLLARTLNVPISVLTKHAAADAEVVSSDAG